MATVDLHLHTTASDGRLTPTELVRLLAARGVEIAAITDHDSTEGLSEALKAQQAFPQLTLIPGIELSTDVPKTEVHILGYFLQWDDRDFQRTLQRFRQGRVRRAQGMVERLAELGLPIEWERVLHFAGDGAVGRPHIALAMMEKGYIKEPREAFVHYIGRNGPAYVEREKLTPADAIALIESVGGVAVLAHPNELADLQDHLKALKAAGLAGMEVHYAHYTHDKVRALAAIARQFDLLPCGGSDYHAMGAEGEPLPGDMGPPEEVVQRLRKLAQGRAKAGSSSVS